MAPVRNRTGKSLQFVVKTSKYCNLRCRYCYELADLGNRSRMSLSDIEKMFRNIDSSVSGLGVDEIVLFWHGGEPLLIPLEFYQNVHSIQKSVFEPGVAISNVLQTNLTVLSDRIIEYLQYGGFFDHLGVSFDLFGDQRVDSKGRIRNQAVLENMRRLRDRNIAFGAVAVLDRHNIAHAADIYRFYDAIGVELRLLPYYRTGRGVEADEHRITHHDLVRAWTDVFRQWMASPSATVVEPISSYVHYASCHIAGQGRLADDGDESVFVVDTNGSIYRSSDAYNSELRCGNIFDMSLMEVMDSDGCRRSAQRSSQRTREFCSRCVYSGHCPGTFVADATEEQRLLLQAQGCPVRMVLDHMVDALKSCDFSDPEAVFGA